MPTKRQPDLSNSARKPFRRQRDLPDGMKFRGNTYYAWFTRNGRTIRKALSKDFDVARSMLRELQSRVEKGDFGILDNGCSWAELKDEFLNWAEQTTRVADDYERDLRLFETFGRVRSIRQIDQKYVIAYRHWRLTQKLGKPPKPGQPDNRRTVSPRTVNREVGTLRNMLNKGVEWRMIATNVVSSIKQLRNDNPAKQRRPLDLAEVRALFEASPEHLRPIWRFFMMTGLRHNELVELRWSDIDFSKGVVRIRPEWSKNHREREIPLDDETMQLLTSLRALVNTRKPIVDRNPERSKRLHEKFSASHVFVTQANTPWTLNLLKRFYACCRKAGIADAHPRGSVDIHSLRVSFATFALDHGANPRAVQEILGHSTLHMTMKVYAKATDRAKRAAVTAIPLPSAIPNSGQKPRTLATKGKSKRTNGAQNNRKFS